MTRLDAVRHEFVECIPETLIQGVVYVSIAYATVAHSCCCGCGNVAYTPLAPGRWALTFDGRSISLDPSIGNWSFPCQSHYWIERNRVHWHAAWTAEKIQKGRARTLQMINKDIERTDGAKSATTAVQTRWRGWFARLRRRFK
ncbi:hypothetical protein ThrDRAFT_01694 [Frankia casuarinae]|uniref:Uncharacterized protein n=1 Tax=Frankia casuarinae (strain DSM 45818 / CECT 9043 / HFP020203 / CcI3) TaxID=106370 RepID=Q2JEM2_FRACC|nr:hypothetical protein Francci3_0886 [Frankia casuarinae]ETA01977.1 hypothetical protein CcI6DRAFT_02663 [Frankia sp. CcI6]EYT92576.1 hypothetical protein ThrDRAFT_01694 [Frankia casuarinae]KFB05419.1 hypothetical protein ALLO2DRAFT_01658 [Frankia sp. Allo2]